MERKAKTMEETVNRFVIERVPEDVRKRYKARCAMEGTSMRDDVVSYMRARSGDVEWMKQMIHKMLLQLVDDTTGTEESKKWVEIQNDFEISAFPESMDNQEESIADAPIDHMPEEFGEYQNIRLQEIESLEGREVTSNDLERIELEWEKIEDRREELQERYDEERED